MKDTMDLLNDDIKKIFKKYLINSITGTMTIAIYIMFDTIFIGWGVGKDGLTALNITIPIYNFTVAISMLLGVGGGAVMSIMRGRGEAEKAKIFFTLSIISAGICSALIAIFGTIFIDNLAYFLGAKPEIFDLVKQYMSILVVFSGAFLFNNMLQVFVRNDNEPRLPMISGVVSGVLNIILDWIFIFVFNWGMRGAIIATIFSTFISLAILMIHFIRPYNTLKFTKPINTLRCMYRISKNGFPSFLIELSTGIVILLFNNRLMKTIGIEGVTAYAIIANINYIIYAVFNGTAQAIQPIISVNIGGGKIKRVYKVFRLGMKTAGVAGALFFLVGVFFWRELTTLFMSNPTKEIFAVASVALPIYFISYIFSGYNIVTGTFLQSSEFAKESTALSLLRGIVLVTIGIYILPFMFGTSAIWTTVPVAEGVSLVFGIILLRRIKTKLSCEYLQDNK